MLFGVVYIPPEGSPFENKDVFTDLENSLLLLEHESVCFLGGFSARTAALNGTTTDGYSNNFDMPVETFEDIGGGGKSSSSLPRRVSQDVVTSNIGFEMLDFCKTAGVLIVNASIWRCTCKNVSVVDYALVSSGFDFCELYSDVHCQIILKLSIMNVQKAYLEQSEIDDDGFNDGDVDKTNLQYTG